MNEKLERVGLLIDLRSKLTFIDYEKLELKNLNPLRNEVDQKILELLK